MADIDTYLRQILSATYGEEVRSSIYNSIKLMNDELNEVDQELTYDQYNQLSPSKQNNGTTYFLTDLKKIMKSGVEYASSGDSLTITTKGNAVRFDATGAPVKEMMIDINPKQHMNGLLRVYKGGDSRNRLHQISPSVSGLEILRNHPLPGAFVLNGTADHDYTIDLGTFEEDDAVGNPFRLTGCAPGGSFDTYYLRIDGQLASGDRYDYGNGANFKVASETATYTVYLVIKSGTTLVNALFKPMIRRQDRYPSDAYYCSWSNICDLHRHTYIEIGAYGKNIFDKGKFIRLDVIEHGKYPDINNLPITDASKGYVWSINNLIKNTTYTISGAIANGPSELYFYNSTKNITRILPVNAYPFTFTTPEDIYSIGFRFDEDAFDLDTIQIEVGEEATSYEPYIDRKQMITWDSGDIYINGGTYNLETGIFTETWGYMAEYDGRDLPGEWLSDRDTYGEKEKPTIGAEVMYKLSTPIIRHIPNSGFITRKGVNTIFNTYALNCESFYYITYYTSMLDDIPKYDILSNSAYEALTEADKLNGTMYFINDKGIIYLKSVAYGANGGGGGGHTFEPLVIQNRSMMRMASSASVDPMPVENVLYWWDFRNSLIDMIEGEEATLDGATQSDEGVRINAAYKYISFNSALFQVGRAYEIKIKTMSYSPTSGTNHARLFMWSSDNGFILKSGSRWSCYIGNAWGGTDYGDVTDKNAFNDSILRIEYKMNGGLYTVTIYKDGVRFYEASTSNMGTLNKLTIGASGQGYYTLLIESFKIIELQTN